MTKSQSPAAQTADHISILVVDDDKEFANDLSAFLREKGFPVFVAHDVPKANQLMTQAKPQMCLVDIVMPGPSGKVFCRDVSERTDAGVIMMSSLSDSDTIIALLEIGADDYVVKPFQFGEIFARLKAVLRRRQATLPVASQLRRVGPWLLELGERRLRHDTGFTVTLTPSEMEILRFMSASPETVFSREDLLAVSRSRQHNGTDDRAIDNLVKRLRKKIEEDTAHPKHLITVWGKGYRLNP